MKNQGVFAFEVTTFVKAVLSAALLLILMSFLGTSLRNALNIGVGVLLCTGNLLFYGIVAAAILIKKNIAWMGPLIVIKYLILIVSVYFVWAYANVLLVLVGLFAELVLTTVHYSLLKFSFLRREKN